MIIKMLKKVRRINKYNEKLKFSNRFRKCIKESNRDEEYNFTVVDDEGKEVICDVISLLQDEKTNDVYIIYTDYTMNDKNQFNTYLSELVESMDGWEVNCSDLVRDRMLEVESRMTAGLMAN